MRQPQMNVALYGYETQNFHDHPQDHAAISPPSGTQHMPDQEPAFPAVYRVGAAPQAAVTNQKAPSFGRFESKAEAAMWEALGRAAIRRMSNPPVAGPWPAAALALTHSDRNTAATLTQVGEVGRKRPNILPPPDPAKIGPLPLLPTFGDGVGHSLPPLPPLQGPAPLTGVTLPAYAGSYGGAKQPSGGGSHGMQFGDPWSPPWMFATPPTDITEPWMPGFDNAGDDLIAIGAWQSAMPPVLTLLCDLVGPMSLKGRRLKGFL